MAAGVPVLCYDLPEIQPIWGGNVAWVPKGDKKKFADRTLELLDNDHARNKLSESGVRFMKNYDWNDIAQKEMSIITSLAEKHEPTNK
jgi:glycosyltransferase involved in cell wall biosynthesis